MRNHWTNAALFCAGLYLAAFTGQAQAQANHNPFSRTQAQADCRDWFSDEAWLNIKFFRVATGPDVRRCLGQGADINARDKGNWTPLHIAARWGTAETITALIDAGAEIDARDEYGFTPLHAAVASIDEKTADVLIALTDAGANIRARTNDGATALDIILLHESIYARAHREADEACRWSPLYGFKCSNIDPRAYNRMTPHFIKTAKITLMALMD